MPELQTPHSPNDLLDHLVLDTCELDRLTERLIQSLTSADLVSFPKGAVTVHIMDLLFRIKDSGDALQRVSANRIKRIADARLSDASGNQKQIRPTRVRMLVDAIDD